jgi:hypothetical protein
MFNLPLEICTTQIDAYVACVAQAKFSTLNTVYWHYHSCKSDDSRSARLQRNPNVTVYGRRHFPPLFATCPGLIGALILNPPRVNPDAITSDQPACTSERFKEAYLFSPAQFHVRCQSCTTP